MSFKTRLEKRAFREPSKYAAAVTTEAARPLLALARRALARRPPLPAKDWTRAILLGDDHIGDVLWRTFSLPFLRSKFPKCEWVFVASEPAAALLRGNPHLASILVSPQPVETRTVSRTAALIRDAHVDAVVCYNAVNYHRDVVAATVAGVSSVAAFCHKGCSGLITHPLPLRFPQPFSAYFSDAINHLADSSECHSLRPEVFVTDLESQTAKGIRDKHFRPIDPILALGVTGRQPHGVQLKHHLAHALREVQLKHPSVQIAVMGAPEEFEELTGLIRATSINAALLAGQLSVRESVAFLRLCHGTLAVDSGLRHMANAAGCPVVFFRNLYSFAVETGRYLDTEVDIAPDVENLSRQSLEIAPPLLPLTEVVAVVESHLLERWSLTTNSSSIENPI